MHHGRGSHLREDSSAPRQLVPHLRYLCLYRLVGNFFRSISRSSIRPSRPLQRRLTEFFRRCHLRSIQSQMLSVKVDRNPIRSNRDLVNRGPTFLEKIFHNINQSNGEEKPHPFVYIMCLLHTFSAPYWSLLNYFLPCHSSQFSFPAI